MINVTELLNRSIPITRKFQCLYQNGQIDQNLQLKSQLFWWNILKSTISFVEHFDFRYFRHNPSFEPSWYILIKVIVFHKRFPIKLFFPTAFSLIASLALDIWPVFDTGFRSMLVHIHRIYDKGEMRTALQLNEKYKLFY